MRFFYWVSVGGGPLEPAEVSLVGVLRTVKLLGRADSITLGEYDARVLVFGKIEVPEWTAPPSPQP